ncbi:hypothetical protein CEUSTIGMA_g10055.t1 [Chlamydomonas eustigma]|uniref:Uncharacterized protein n=1 Tax=Chlamydomonas eustigma TaxID=1157962 RepID=A0A250XI86_9CHLO|nr:hypothetical protein CEUSTIGMA_g10055.t1 [Chlamydomonas eustigma]|eukprot:GAX82629.1 hypothetical protein CEUSTIGMA_g10055.t1 [Chlamydomonas eustigma]
MLHLKNREYNGNIALHSQVWRTGQKHCLHSAHSSHRFTSQAIKESQSLTASHSNQRWPAFLIRLFLSGAVSGTLLDGIHSRTGLQVYELLPFDVGGLHSSWCVPPLLGSFYVVLGSMFILADQQWPSSIGTSKILNQCQDGRFVAAGYGALAVNLQISAALFAAGVPFHLISLALACVSLGTWKIFDGTVQGAALSAFCAVGAPLSEILLLHYVPMWSYPLADLDLGAWGGFVSWVPWCYFFYTPVLGALSRNLWQALDAESSGSNSGP